MSLREKRAVRRAEKDMNRLYKEHHREEAERLRRVVAEKIGHKITVQDAEGLWMAYSDEQWAAGWIGMPADDQDLADVAMEFALMR